MMKRRIFTIASTLSLLVFLATCALWVRSYSRADCLRHMQPSHESGAESALGKCLFISSTYTPEWFSRPTWEYESRTAYELSTHINPRAKYDWQALGGSVFSADFTTGGLRVTGHGIIVPDWLPAIIFGAMPTGWMLAKRRRSINDRFRRHCCQQCGYDLRATPDRCPECGAVPETVMP